MKLNLRKIFWDQTTPSLGREHPLPQKPHKPSTFRTRFLFFSSFYLFWFWGLGRGARPWRKSGRKKWNRRFGGGVRRGRKKTSLVFRFLLWISGLEGRKGGWELIKCSAWFCMQTKYCCRMRWITLYSVLWGDLKKSGEKNFPPCMNFAPLSRRLTAFGQPS